MSPPILDPVRGALLRSQPDWRLVTLVREGRERAFEEIVRRYRSPLVGFAAMIIPADRADDVVQESLVAAYTALLEADSEIVLRPWLFRIVRNRALNDLRDTPTADPLPEELDGVAQPSEIAERNEQVAALLGGLQALPDQQREAIVARELEGRGHAEIAAELGTSAGAVRQLIFRARGTLRGAAGVLVPLPVLRFLLGPDGTETGAAATTAGAGVAALAGGGAAAGVGSKVAIGLAGVAIAVGGGIAVERSRDGGNGGSQGESGRETGDIQALASSGSRADGAAGGRSGSGSGGDGGGGSGSGSGHDGGGEGGRSGPGGDGGGVGGGGDSSGSGGGGSSDGDGGDGDGDDFVGDFDDDDDNSGSGSTSSGSGSSGSGSSGSGPSGSGDDDLEPTEIEIDDSGPSISSGTSGSGSSGSGSSGFDSSGSGSGDDGDDLED